MSNLSRRRFLSMAAVVAAPCYGRLRPDESPSLSTAKTTTPLAVSGEKGEPRPLPQGRGERPTKICIFSKHLQWLGYQDMAQTAAEIGFDGLDLTVRRGGHISPERVQEDLPKAIQAVKAAELDVPMITTSITDPDDALTESILVTASRLGIRYYRMGYYKYEDSKTIRQTLREVKPMLRDLVEMNKRYNIVGTYQNHAGSKYVGSPIWDLHHLLRDLDTRWIGCQFDIRHATVEGGTVWPIHFRLISEYINTLAAKDFLWAQEGDTWRPQNCPLGEGMVDFPRYFGMLRQARLTSGGQAKIAAPFSLHLEYSLGGAEKGTRHLTVAKEKVIEAMRKDLHFLRKCLA